MATNNNNKVPPNPVTPQARDCFAMYVQKWAENLNLNDWRIVASSKPANKAHMAEINMMDLKARLATYRIGTDFGSIPVTDHSIEETACHEVWHVRLCELIEVCRNPASTEDQIASAEHAVINAVVSWMVPVGDLAFAKT